MYYYFYHGFDLRKIIRFLCEFECIEFECNEFVLVLVFGRLFWRQLRIGGNWLHIIFQRIVLEAAQNWRELVCRRPFRIVPYTCTFVQYDGTFGAPD